jgi:lipoprotein-releasing system permease protein
LYKLHLILKYLRKRRIAWVSLLAVTLCVTMVLVVISVMGGWLRMFRTSFHGLSGDIVVQSGSLSGFPYYDDMIAEIEKLPEVNAAVPVIQTFGLINIANRKTAGVQVIGYPIEKIGKVNEFTHSLWRQYNQWLEWADGAPIEPEDRTKLREQYGLTVVRPGDPLLKLTPEERERIRKAIPEAQAKAEAARNAMNAATDPAEKDRKLQDAEEAAWLAGRLRELAAGGDDDVADVNLRRAIRDEVGKIVDDPDERLAPSDAERAAVRAEADKEIAHPSFKPFLPPLQYENAFRANNPRAKEQFVKSVPNWDGMIAGTGVVNVHKDSKGNLVNRGDYLYKLPVSLTVMGVSSAGKLDFGGGHERNYWIVDTSRTKVWQYDSNTVYVPFKVLQQDLGMDAQQAEQEGKPITLPARTTEIHVGVKEQYRHSSDALVAIRDKIKPIVERVLEQKAREGRPFEGSLPVVRTWEESQAKWMGAIEKEMVLVTFLFGMISVVAVFLIFCIFYMIVVEKTRDIGIIKSVGATSSGVAAIFLGYGAVIGILGAALGLLIGYLIVHNINTLHAWLGTALHVQVWDPEVYAFDTIPNTLEPFRVAWILGIAVVASIIGALVPAIRAARLNPVEALRWE